MSVRILIIITTIIMPTMMLELSRPTDLCMELEPLARWQQVAGVVEALVTARRTTETAPSQRQRQQRSRHPVNPLQHSLPRCDKGVINSWGRDSLSLSPLLSRGFRRASWRRPSLSHKAEKVARGPRGIGWTWAATPAPSSAASRDGTRTCASSAWSFEPTPWPSPEPGPNSSAFRTPPSSRQD